MSSRTKKIAVFYRDIPATLERAVAADPDMKLIKDGVYTFDHIRLPRATVSFDWTGSQTDQEKLAKLLELLKRLETNNQIVAFSIRS